MLPAHLVNRTKKYLSFETPSILPFISLGPWPSYLPCLNVYVCICKIEYSYLSQRLLGIVSSVSSSK